MGKLLSVLVLCLVLSIPSLADNAIDDARIMTGNIPSPDAAIKAKLGLVSAASRQSRNALFECWWLGRLQESLINLTTAVGELPSYGDTGKKVTAVNDKLGAYCGLTSGATESPLAKINVGGDGDDVKKLKSLIETDLEPVLNEIKSVHDSEVARYNKLKGDADRLLNEKNKAVEKINTTLQDNVKRSGIPNVKFK